MPDTTRSLQSQLDSITSQTRALVQPERLAVTDASVQSLLDSGLESRILPLGAPAPTFALPDAINGKLVRSSDLLAVGPLIVTFFRGRWCPYCMTELEAWQAAFPAVRERGALLVAISPQLPRQNDFTVQQHHLTYPLLTDAGCRLATQFGIAYTVPDVMRAHYRSILINIPFIHGPQPAPPGASADDDLTWRLPLPATFVISQQNTILFAQAHADHRVRPDPAEVLSTLRPNP
jgi:peroxiredoxin